MCAKNGVQERQTLHPYAPDRVCICANDGVRSRVSILCAGYLRESDG